MLAMYILAIEVTFILVIAHFCRITDNIDLSRTMPIYGVADSSLWFITDSRDNNLGFIHCDVE